MQTYSEGSSNLKRSGVQLSAPSSDGPYVTDAADADVVVAARDLGKAYRLFDRPQDRLKDQLLWRFGRHYGRELWALRNVSFTIRAGEAFGVIGRNGSGKSTLLQLLVGVLKPTEGSLEVHGRVAAMLELGSGFNPELTGRENIYLSGSVLGLSDPEIDARFDEIVTFSELGSFIEQPVKYYSSGMFVRLAFSLNSSVSADVLVIDEAIAVGDVFFQQKCYRRLEQLREAGVTILLVSHAMPEVEQFCDRGLVLEAGQARFLGAAREAVQRYYVLSQDGRPRLESVSDDASNDLAERKPGTEAGTEAGLAEWEPERDAWLELSGAVQVSNGQARCLGVALCDEAGRARRVFAQGETAVFVSDFEILAPFAVPVAGVVLHNARGVTVHGKSTLEYDSRVPQGLRPGDRIRFRQAIQMDVGISEYTFEVGISSLPKSVFDIRASMPHDLFAAEITRVCDVPDLGPFVVTWRPVGSTPVQLLHHGVANLPGRCDTRILAAGRVTAERQVAVLSGSIERGEGQT